MSTGVQGRREGGPGGQIVTIQKVADLLPIFTTVRTVINLTVGRTQRFILADATDGAISVTLPAAPQSLPVTIKKVDTSANAVTVRIAGPGTIDGATTAGLASHNDSIVLVPNERVDTNGNRICDWFASGTGAGSAVAPASATYITQTPNVNLSAEQALSLLATGLLKVTTATGVVSIAVSADIIAALGFTPPPNTRSIIAGAGLAGGGDLSADRTIDVNVDSATIEINSDTLRVKAGGIGANEIAATAVAAGSYVAANLTVDADGRLTAAASGGVWSAYTPTRTGWTDVGSPAVTARKCQVGNLCFFQIQVVPGTTVATVAGTSYVSLPITGAGITGSASMMNLTTLAGVGECVIDMANSRVYVPSQAATANTLTIGGWYEV